MADIRTYQPLERKDFVYFGREYDSIIIIIW